MAARNKFKTFVKYGKDGEFYIEKVADVSTYIGNQYAVIRLDNTMCQDDYSGIESQKAPAFKVFSRYNTEFNTAPKVYKCYLSETEFKNLVKKSNSKDGDRITMKFHYDDYRLKYDPNIGNCDVYRFINRNVLKAVTDIVADGVFRHIMFTAIDGRNDVIAIYKGYDVVAFITCMANKDK